MRRPKRIRLSRRKGWRLPANTVNVARPGKWGNPFKTGVDGTAAECVDLHRKLLCGFLCMSSKASTEDQRRTLKYATEHIGDLKGKDVACWCAVDASCHGDTLLWAANAWGNR